MRALSTSQAYRGTHASQLSNVMYIRCVYNNRHTKGPQMQQTIISHKSALFLTRYNRLRDAGYDCCNEICNIKDFMEHSPLNKIDVLLKSPNEKYKRKFISNHICVCRIPKNSFLKHNDNFSYVCPELLLINLSNQICFEHLMLLIHELCGTYTFDPLSKESISDISAVTSVSKINAYLKHYKAMNSYAYGARNLEKALKYCKDNSASPMESRLYIKLCGPRNLGFYGCKNIMLNKPISLSKEAALIAGQHTVMPDLLHLKKKIAIEYDSAQYHENVRQGQKDKCRRDALVCDG